MDDKASRRMSGPEDACHDANEHPDSSHGVKDEPRHESISDHDSKGQLPAEPSSEQPISSTSPDGDPAETVPPPYSVFTLTEKRLIVLAASLSAFFSPLTAQIYFPALNLLAEDFHVSDTKINLTVTTYMVFQGVTPMFIGGFADTGGRRPAYIFCFVVYIAAAIGVALSNKYASLLVLRCLQSAGSASTVALCQAVVADCITSAERGQYIGITVLPIVLAPSLGPVLGGVLAEYLGWRSIFWFLTIIAAVTLLLILFFFPETCRPIVGDGSIKPHPAYRTVYQLLKDANRKRKSKKPEDPNAIHRTTTATSRASQRKPLKVKFGNPLMSLRLLFEKELGLLLSFSAIVFAGFYAMATAMPSQFADLYGFNDLKVGLMYLPMGGGSVVAAFLMGPAINWNYRRHALKLGMPVDKARQQDLSKFPIEKARLEIGLPLLALASCVLLAWGWAIEYRAPVAVPCVLLFLMGVGMIGFSNTSNVLLVDIYPFNAGAAVAANNLTRCLLGAVASAVIVPMINAMGSGWAFTLIGLLYVLCAPCLWLIMNKGMKWRRQMKEREEKRKARNQAKKDKKRRSMDEGKAHDGPGKDDEKIELPAEMEKEEGLAGDGAKKEAKP